MQNRQVCSATVYNGSLSKLRMSKPAENQQREKEFICQTKNTIYMQITNKCGRLPEKA